MTVRRVTAVTCAFLFCLALFAGPSAAEESYKVGAVFSVTGPASFLGDPEKKTAQMVTDAINKAIGEGAAFRFRLPHARTVEDGLMDQTAGREIQRP